MQQNMESNLETGIIAIEFHLNVDYSNVKTLICRTKNKDK